MALPLAALLLAAVSPAAVAHASKTAQAPAIDGRLDDAAWVTAVPTDAFVQHYPVAGEAPSERTTMRVVYDEDALYFGFDCEQIHSPIIDRLTRRDRDTESEWISVRIDSKNEGRLAFSFGVNATGVLADALISDPGSWSFEWDETWEASTTRTPNGWSAEFRIPFRVLRFDPNDVASGWSLQAGRYIAQKQEADMWPHLPRETANPLAHFGRLEGLEGIKPSFPFELRPFVTGRVRRLDATDLTSATGYDARVTAGIDIKWHLAPDLTLDAAVLPDFGQVEADQVILNLTNYETFLPEKRPLFLEGADVFSFPLQIFYSRRIGIAPIAPTLLATDEPNAAQLLLVNLPEPATIYGAAKVVGRVARNWTVGALASVTGRNEVTVADSIRTKRLVAPVTTQTAFRLKRDWVGTGHVGLMATGVTTFENAGGAPAFCPSGMAPPPGRGCFRDSYVAGADALWRSPSGDYIANAAVIGSLVRGGSDTTQLDGTVIAPGARAPGGWLRAAKDGGKLLASVAYTGMGRTLDYNDLGFMPRQNLHEVKASVGYRTFDPGRLTLDTSSAFEVTQRRSLSGLDLGQLYALSGYLRLKSFWRLSGAIEAAPRRFDDREIGTGVSLERRGYLGARADMETDPKRAVVASVATQVQISQDGAQMVSAQGALTLLPLPQLEIALEPQVVWAGGEFRYARQTVGGDPLFGRLEALNVGAILRASYTFAPRVSLQTYAQAYLAAGHFTGLRAFPTVGFQQVSTEALAATPPLVTAPTPSPDFEQAALNVNVVFRWEYRLGSTLFLVYTRSQMPDIFVVNPPAMLQAQALGRRAAADVIMLKLSYWWAG